MYEVRVEVAQKGSRHFSSHVSMFIYDKIIKMFHISARTPEQAKLKAEKKGRCLSVRKANAEKMGFNVEGLLLREPFAAHNPYPDAIAMDEQVWRKKSKRATRLESKEKDKVVY